MPPMDVPMMRSGFSLSQMLRSRVIASSGSTGRSGAIISVLGSRTPIVFTVPFWPPEANPCTYKIFLPAIKSGLAYS